MTSTPVGGSVFKPAFMLMSGRALGFVAAFAIPVVLVRVFDQTEFGTYKQLFLLYTTLYGIAQLGMQRVCTTSCRTRRRSAAASY